MDCLFELISGFIHLAIKTFTKTAAGEIKKKKSIEVCSPCDRLLYSLPMKGKQNIHCCEI